MDEIIIVTYSPKYKAYQQKIRKGKNQNDPARFVKQTLVTDDGEVASKTIYDLDMDKVDEESKYDGFYAVITNLEDDVAEIIRRFIYM